MSRCQRDCYLRRLLSTMGPRRPHLEYHLWVRPRSCTGEYSSRWLGRAPCGDGSPSIAGYSHGGRVGARTSVLFTHVLGLLTAGRDVPILGWDSSATRNVSRRTFSGTRR